MKNKTTSTENCNDGSIFFGLGMGIRNELIFKLSKDPFEGSVWNVWNLKNSILVFTWFRYINLAGKSKSTFKV